MNANKRRRVARLEQSICPEGRTFYVFAWERALLDMAAEIERLKIEQGLTDHDNIVAITCLPPQ